MMPRLHLRDDAVGVDRGAAVDRADDAVHADLAAVSIDTSATWATNAAERFVHRERRGRSPAGGLPQPALARRRPRGPSAVRGASFSSSRRSSSGSRLAACGELVDEALHRERGVRVADRAPPQDGHGVARRVHRHVVRRDLLRGTASRRRPRRQLVVGRRPTGPDRLPGDGVPPGDALAVLVEPGLDAMDEHRPVVAAADVVLARPDRLHRRAGRLGDLRPPRRRSRWSPSARRPNPPPRNIVWIETFSGVMPRISAGDRLVAGLELRAGPDLAALPASIRTVALSGSIGACARYGHLVDRLELAGRARRAPRRRRPARRRLGPGFFASSRSSASTLSVSSDALAEVPLDLERLAPLRRRPEVVGDHRDAASAPRRPCARPGPLSPRRRLNDFTLPPKTGDRATTAVKQARQLDVDAELGAPGDLLRACRAACATCR